MDIGEIKKIYARYSRIYDLIFKRWFHPRHQHVIRSLDVQPDQCVLDVGVGTGLSLPLYPRQARVIGVDLSSKMLREAQKRVRDQHLTHVTLLEMNAEHLAFPDNTFDVVMAAFVISVVPNPVHLVAEMKRVSKPEGQLVIINHFQSANPIMARLVAG